MKIKNQTFFKYTFMCCVLLSIVISVIITCQQHKNEHWRVKTLAQNEASQITGNVNQALAEVYGAEMMIIATDGKDFNLENYKNALIHPEYKEYVQNILIAPNGKISQVYPKEGNEARIGIDMSSKEYKAYKSVEKTANERDIVVSEPYKASDDKMYIEGIKSIYIPQQDGTEKKWGLAAITLKYPEIINMTAEQFFKDCDCSYRILNYNDKMNNFVEMYANNFEEGKSAESVEFEVYNMRYKIEVYPNGGWKTVKNGITIFLISFACLLILSIIAYLFRVKSTRLKATAMTDGLTGLLNRNAAKAQIDKILQSKSFSSYEFYLIDIDRFKSVNDTLGHQMGDEVLKECANVLRSTFRANDIICRLGGDEFLALMAHDNGRSFLSVKLNQVLDGMNKVIGTDDKMVKLSCSIGVAFAPEHAYDFEGLYRCADKALYRSKESGRNRASIYSKETDK